MSMAGPYEHVTGKFGSLSWSLLGRPKGDGCLSTRAGGDVPMASAMLQLIQQLHDICSMFFYYYGALAFAASCRHLVAEDYLAEPSWWPTAFPSIRVPHWPGLKVPWRPVSFPPRILDAPPCLYGEGFMMLLGLILSIPSHSRPPPNAVEIKGDQGYDFLFCYSSRCVFAPGPSR